MRDGAGILHLVVVVVVVVVVIQTSTYNKYPTCKGM
jgi:Sec-independent protein translocase protein TatA